MFRKKRKEEGAKYGDITLEPLILQNSRLKFSPEQLQNLNFVFNKKLQYRHDYLDKTLSQAKSVAERLIQRLLCAAGSADSRFASKFLIVDNSTSSHNDIFQKGLSYLVRLDELSTPCLYDLDSTPRLEIIENDSDCPPAYCRIRLPTAAVSLWGEFLNPSYFLRRDKVQTRLVELLANAAGSDTPNSSLHVDESILCGVPGKLVDAATLYHLLKVPSFQHIYYGPGGSMPRFPDPRDFRIAIVDEPEGIRLKIEFLSPAFANTCLNIRLLVAVGVDAWPSSSKFPHRISMAHCDCLLYHKAATTGMYLVGYGVQSSAWQIRVPAAENTILNHYSESSTIRTILDILYDSIEEIEISRNLKKHQISYKILNKYIMLTVLLEELEKSSSNPLNDLISWSPIYLSSIVLKLLEKLMSSLVQQMLPNYFFENSNLMVNPGHLSEDDFILEANNIKMYLVKLFDESMKPLSGDRDFNKMIQIQESEITLLCKWRELIQGMLPQFSRRGRGFCFVRFQNRQDSLYTQYTKNQLEYISLVLKSVLDVRQNILTTNNDLVKHNFNTEDTEVQHVMEDIIYLIILLMDQAKALYLNPSENSTLPKKKSKARSQYNQCTTKFIELIRKDQSIKSLDIEDDLVMVKTILKWLYTAMDYNKRYLSLVLKPFLSKIFETSFAISWHLDSIKETSNRDELESLGHFCKLVNSYEITPAQGLIDASNKNWIWAKDILEMVDKHTLRIVFVSDRGKVIRHILSLPSYKKRETSQSVGCSRSGSKRSTLPNRSYFNTIMRKGIDDNIETNQSQHEMLKRRSPLSVIIDKFNRRGEHKVCGDIFKSLMAMQKMSIFHEVTSHLPEEDRSKLSETIHQLQIAKTRRLHSKKWSTTLPSIQRTSTFTSRDLLQKYTPTEESAGIREKEKYRHTVVTETNTLMRNCRALRLKEDSVVVPFQNDSKIKTLLRKSESFKY